MRGRRARGSFDLGGSCAIFVIMLGAVAYVVLTYRGVEFPTWAKIAGIVGAIVLLMLGMSSDSSSKWPNRDAIWHKPEEGSGGGSAGEPPAKP
jgi:hypothetical protein